MITAADILAQVTAEKTQEDRIIGILQTLIAGQANLAQQLQDAIAASDQPTMQTVADELVANAAAMQAAADAIQPAPPPPAPTP